MTAPEAGKTGAGVREAAIDLTASLAAAISLLERGSKKAAPSNKMFDMMLDDYRRSCARSKQDQVRRPRQAERGRRGMRALPNIDPEFIVICQSAWMNAADFGISYAWDGERFNNRNDAIKHGWRLRGSDDFNIAQTYGDDLVWFGWMDQRIDEDEDTAREIAEAVGLSFDPRWYALEYSKATGRVVARAKPSAEPDGVA